MKFLAGLFLSASLSFSPLFFTGSPQQDPENPSKSFQVTKGGNLEVDVDPGSVFIQPWAKDEVFIQAENIDDRNPERLQMTQSGNTVRLKYRDRRRDSRDLRFTVNVPVQFNVHISTTGGSVEQRDQLKGEFSVDTKGGNIELEEVDGTVGIESGGGNIRGQKIDGNAKIRTGGGNVTIKMLTGEGEASSGGGSMRFENVGKSLKLDTGGGSVAVGDVGAGADIRTGGGSVKVGKVLQSLRLTTGGGSVEVKGASGDLTVRTGGGSVSMEDCSGTLALKTGGGDVSVELTPSGKGGSTVYSGGGDVKFWIPEDAKASIQATLKIKHEWGNPWKRYKINSDFKSDKYEKDEDGELITAAYTLNGGGDKIELETTNGSIDIRKMKK
ncbi:MAG TPA: hypothetical protein VI758_03925 [Bacteroidota bacterium]